jgi:uncharacterized protein YraI
MRRTLLLAAILVGGLLAPSYAGAQYYGYAMRNVNVRAGPDRSYPLVGWLQEGTAVEIFGCLESWRWCDLQGGFYRGWVYAGFIAVPYQGGWAAIRDIGPDSGLPLISFTLNVYWDSFYMNWPWYPQWPWWASRPPIYVPPWRPPPRPPIVHPRPPIGVVPPRPPVVAPPIAKPPGGKPPVATPRPPVAVPPATRPPVVSPPARPPSAVPPATRPPGTLPPRVPPTSINPAGPTPMPGAPPASSRPPASAPVPRPQPRPAPG